MTAPGRIAWFSVACLVTGICILAVGAAPDGVLTKFGLIRPVVAAEPLDANASANGENGGLASEGHPAPWHVVAAAGSPVYRHLEQSMSGWEPVSVGLTLASYAEIDTGSGGRLELFNGNDRMILAPDTTVALPPAAADSPDLTIFQSGGEADYKVRSRRQPGDGLLSRFGRLFLAGSRPTGRFDVYTPHLVAAVKGTAFHVTVDEEHASVSVAEGVVSVSDMNDGRSVDVRAGRMATAGGTAGGTSGGLTVGASAKNLENRNNAGNDNSQGENGRAGDSQGENGRDGDDQGGDKEGGDVDSQ